MFSHPSRNRASRQSVLVLAEKVGATVSEFDKRDGVVVTLDGKEFRYRKYRPAYQMLYDRLRRGTKRVRSQRMS